MPASLFGYQKQVQRFIRDSRQELIDPQDILEYVNQARREVAMRAQCIRVLPPISGACVSVLVLNGGAGYGTNPTVVITPPDSGGSNTKPDLAPIGPAVDDFKAIKARWEQLRREEEEARREAEKQESKE